MRIFIALKLPAPVRQELNKLMKKWQKFHWPVRWEKIEKIHITLVFLGNVKMPSQRLVGLWPKNLKVVIRRAVKDVQPFEVGVKGLGCFPDFVQPRIVWMGLKGDLKSLARLQKQINQELTAAGFEFRQRPFQPHLTIGRVKKGISHGALADLGKKIRQQREINFKNKIPVNSVAIIQGQLARPTSIHTQLAEIKLSLDK